MCDYSFTELADMHYCYGFADGESHEAAKIYAEKYPDRDHPDHTVFQKIDLQLRNGGCLTEEDRENVSHKMADSEVKRKGRPKKREAEAVVATPTKKSVSNGDDAAPPVKRGRGRPPKGGAAAAKKSPSAAAGAGTGRGRGRPPKAAAKSPPKKKKESEEEEDEVDDEEDDDDEKKSTSSVDDVDDVESS